MAEPTERWLPVVGWEGYYEVSDLGRVRSVDRTIIRSDGKVKRWRGRLLRQHAGPGTHGYPTVALSRGSDPKNRLVHQLVLEAFVGRCPEGQESRHGPGGKLDARLTNLCYGTRSENVRDRTRDGHDNRGERHGGHKLTWEAVRDIRQQADALTGPDRRRLLGEVECRLARKYGVSQSTISLVVLRKGWFPEPIS